MFASSMKSKPVRLRSSLPMLNSMPTPGAVAVVRAEVRHLVERSGQHRDGGAEVRAAGRGGAALAGPAVDGRVALVVVACAAGAVAVGGTGALGVGARTSPRRCRSPSKYLSVRARVRRRALGALVRVARAPPAGPVAARAVGCPSRRCRGTAPCRSCSRSWRSTCRRWCRRWYTRRNDRSTRHTPGASDCAHAAQSAFVAHVSWGVPWLSVGHSRPSGTQLPQLEHS